MEWSLKTWLAPWAYVASVVYHDMFWYPFSGNRRVHAALRSDWGRLFFNWEKTAAVGDGYPDVGPEPGGIVRGVGQLLKMAVGILWTCLREAPELAVRKRRSAAVRGA